MPTQAWLLKWGQRVGVAFSASLAVLCAAGLMLFGFIWILGEDIDRLRDRLEQSEARRMDEALRQAFAAKDRARTTTPFPLSDVLKHRARSACVFRSARLFIDKNDDAVALAQRAGRIWFWRSEKADATLALDLADGTARLLRIEPPIELRFERSGYRSICAPPDRLILTPLSSDDRGVVFLVRSD